MTKLFSGYRSECLSLTLIACFLIFCSNKINAQNRHTLSGYIKDATSGEVLIGANIYDRKSKQGTAANQFGFYSLTLSEDSVDLIVSYVGYLTGNQKLMNNKPQQINFNLQTSTLQEVIVTSDKALRIEERSQMSSIDIPIQQIKSLPAFLGEVDVLNANSAIILGSLFLVF